MINPTIEKDWITPAGLRAAILFSNRLGCRLGYVGIPADHPLHGVLYGTVADILQEDGKPTDPMSYFNVHGGITYDGNSNTYPVESDGTLFWYGYDCNHYDDAPSLEFIRVHKNEDTFLYNPDGVHRTLEFCIAECESLAEQLQKFKKEEDLDDPETPICNLCGRDEVRLAPRGWYCTSCRMVLGEWTI